MLGHHVNISREMRLAMEAKQRDEGKRRARPYGDGRYTLDQVLAAVQIVRPGFGDGLGPEQARRLAAPLRDEAVAFLDALNPFPSSSAPSVVNSDLPDEREFIRQAVAVFGMISFEDLPVNRLGIRFGHGHHHATYVLSKQSKANTESPDALPLAFAGLVEGCVREGRKIIAAYDAQEGTP